MRTALRLVGPGMLLVLLVAGLSVASAQDSGSPGSGRAPTAVSLTPSESWDCIMNQQTVTASAMDSSGGVPNTRVEFMLNRFPGAVGDIVEVNGGSPSKMDNAYAVAHTGGSGEATATLTATRPGSADITAFVPAVLDPGAHKKFGVVHWVDGCPSFPSNAENPVGMDHPVVVSVMNVSDGSPVEGASFRFRITDDEPNAEFAGADGDGNVAMAATDENGMASVTLSQTAPELGDNDVYIEMLSDSGETMFSHTMTKMWKSPVLGISAFGPATAGLLGEVTYDITASNSGDFAATDAVLTMELAAGLRFVSSSMPSTVEAAEGGAQTVMWSIGDLAVGQTTALTLTAQAMQVGLQTSPLRLVSAEGLSAQTSVATTVTPGSLEVSKTGPAMVNLGGTATYTIQTLSVGFGASTGIRLVDTIPSGMSFVSADRDYAQDGNQITFELGTLTQGSAATVQIVLQADETGAMENMAAATSAEGGSAQDSALTQVVSAVLATSKTGPASALVNVPFDYALTVSNAGDGVARGVMLTDTLPGGLQFVSSNPAGTMDGQTISWSLGDLQPGTSRVVTLTVRGVEGGEMENTVTASADGITPSMASATTLITAPSISLTKTGRPALFIGNQATYELAVANTGDADLTGVVITDTIPNGMSYVSSNPAASVNGSQLTWQVGGLAVGSDANISVTLMADAIGNVVNSATATSAEGASATATLDIEVLPAAGASITITDSFDPVREGEALEFMVTVSNQGRSAITGVMIEVNVPAALAVTSVSDAAATTSEDGRTVTLRLASALGVDESRSFTISVTANDLPAGSGARIDTKTTATLTYNEFSLPVSAEEGTTVIER